MRLLQFEFIKCGGIAIPLSRTEL